MLRCLLVLLLLLGSGLRTARAQEDGFDPSWYDPARPYLKVAVVEDGVYRVTGADLSAHGVPVSSIDPATLQLFENGREVPLHYTGDPSRLTRDAALLFVGRRNRGTGEAWVYQNDPALQSSDYYSLYTDTTYYWLTWGGAAGLRYRLEGDGGSGATTTAFQDTLHLEQDVLYHAGYNDQEEENPFYTQAEGYYWYDLKRPDDAPLPLDRTAPLTDLDTDGPAVEVRVRLNGVSNTPHLVTLEAETVVNGNRAYRQIGEVAWERLDLRTLRGTVPAAEVPEDGLLKLRIVSKSAFTAGSNVPFDFVTLDWVEVVYPRTLTAEDGELAFSFAEPGPRRAVLEGFGEAPVLVFSPADARLFERAPSGGTVSFSHAPAVPPAYWAVAESALRVPADLLRDRSTDWAGVSNRADYVILTTPALRPSAEALAAYRQGQDGYVVEIVEVQDVYDQFDYGRPTPLAIRRFIHQTQRWSTAPRFVTLWGDAYYADRTRPRPEWEVPSFGYASSDGWLAVNNLAGQTDPAGRATWNEVVALGRISVRDNEAGRRFVQKLQTYEDPTRPPARWEKRMIVLAAGNSAGEQRTLENATDRWAALAASPPTGMDTLKFYSVADNPFPDPSFQDSLGAALRRGASWLTYFGHSFAGGWQIVTAEPKDYGNAGRLPFVISLGCRTGAFPGGSDVNSDIPVLSENLVLASLNGAIAHWGSSGLSAVYASERLSQHLHELAFADTLRLVGPMLQETKRRYVGEGNASLPDLAEYSLLGDPATRLTLPTRPDFRLASELVRVTPLTPVPADSHLTVVAQVDNFGLVPADTVTVQLTHRQPGGAQEVYTARLAPFRLQEQVVFEVRLDDGAVGNNTLRIEADPEQAYAEESEANNAVDISHLVFSTDLTLVSPLPLGVAGEAPRLRVTFSRPGAEAVPVEFQLDTSPTFDSPALRTYETTSNGTYADWQLTEPLEPGRPYYWRARVASPGEPVNWREGAFFVGADGSASPWMEEGDLFAYSTPAFPLSREDGQWALGSYDVSVQFTSEKSSGVYKGRFFVDGVEYEFRGRGFGMLVLDGQTGEVRSHGSMPTYPNDLETPEHALAEIDSVLGTLHEGDYVFVRTRHVGNQGGTTIDEAVKDRFRTLGSSAIDTLTYGNLWLMMTHVGHPEETKEWVHRDTTEIAQDTVLTFRHAAGQVVSAPIGPAAAWTALHWETELPNATSAVVLDVLAADGETVLLDGLTTSPADLTGIDAADHPYLRLRATLSDASREATPQLLRWSVDFTPVPEVALDRAAFSLSADTLQEHASLAVTASVRNLSDTPAGRLRLTLELTDAQNRTTLVDADTLSGLAADGAAEAQFTVPTAGLVGRNLLTLRIQQLDAAELLTSNNTLFGEFVVLGDREPPTMRVTIEGEALPNDPLPVPDVQDPRIPNIQVRPTIEIVFADENAFQPLSDTSLVVLTLDDRRLSLQDPDVQFEPATATRNEARVLFTPDFTGQDTVHTLRVTVFDAAGNEAAGSPYQVHFRVTSAMKVASLYPYPNPMSSFTQFAFLLQGADADLIDDFRIRVYSLSGQVIREFDLLRDPGVLDGGLLRIGWNKVFWDGRDDDGDLLGTGVYLYRVFLKANGLTINVNNDSSIEKLVVLR